MKCVILGLLGLQNGVMPDLRDMTQLKRKREVEEETEKSESSLEEECKRFRSQYVSPQVTLFGKLFYLCLFCRLHLHRPTSPQSKIYSYRHTSPRCGENGYKASIPTRQLR